MLDPHGSSMTLTPEVWRDFASPARLASPRPISSTLPASMLSSRAAILTTRKGCCVGMHGGS